MKSKIKKLKGTARQFEISLSSEYVNKALDEVLEDIRKTAVIPGFRKGKAPIDVIRKKHGEDAMDEVKKRLVPEAYQAAVDEHNITPVSYPEISDIALDVSGNMTFKAKVDIHPDVKARKYKGLRATRHKISVKGEEVEEALSKIRDMHADFVEKDKPVEKGDFSVCDVEALVDGKVISKKRENMWIEADKESSMLGLGEEICGMKKGDKKEIDVTLPDNYPDKNYAGKKAVFNVEVKEVRQKKLPEMNDELAKKVNKENLEQVREEIKNQMMERKEYNNKVRMKNQIMEQLLKRHSFDIPETMVERQLDVLMQRAMDEMKQKGVPADTVEAQKGNLKERLKKDAEDKVRLYFILNEIAKEENIDVSQEEIDKWLGSLAESYNQPFDKVKQYYEEKDLIGGLKEQLREDKTLDFLLAEAAVAEEDKKD